MAIQQTSPVNIFDGRRNGYLPPERLSIDPSLALHTEANAEVDPITFEVIRAKLWNLNLEHGEAVQRASGSPIVVHGNDYQTSIHTEDGESVMFGPAMLYFAGTADAMLKWTLENRSANPGIEEGDVFVQDDPYIGCNHQMDTSVFCPVFWEDRLFCWLDNCSHWYDVGGVVMGSFVPQAPDIFHEGTPVPPIRVVAKGRLQRDVEELLRRRSRLPEQCGLELRSQLAGLAVAKQRMRELLERYGAPTVKGVMRRMLEQTEQTVRRRLATLPDGTWHDVTYLGCVAPNDRTLRQQVMTLSKRGETLSFENAGTSAQYGSANCSATTWRAAIVNAALLALAWDQKLCAGGLLRCLRFAPTPGLSNSCTYPAAVSGTSAAVTTVYQAITVISKMLGCSAALCRMVMAASGHSTLTLSVITGQRRTGDRFVDIPTGHPGLGAFSFRDGVSFGGHLYNLRYRNASWEVAEQTSPVLFLFARARQQGGGHGRWRGGTSVVYAFIRHKAMDLRTSNFALSTALPASPGLAGGYLGSGGTFYFAEESGVRDELARGRIPGTPDELRRAAPNGRAVRPKESDVVIGERAVWEMSDGTAPGYGDPLLRSAQQVAFDVAEGELSEEIARRLYGVVLKAGGEADEGATAAERQRIRNQRLREAAPPRNKLSATATVTRVRHPLTEQLDVVEAGNGAYIRCRCCNSLLAPAAENYKLYCPALDVPLPSIDPTLFSDPRRDVDADIVYRQYVCPGCGMLLQNDVCRAEDEPIWDIRLAL